MKLWQIYSRQCLLFKSWALTYNEDNFYRKEKKKFEMQYFDVNQVLKIYRKELEGYIFKFPVVKISNRFRGGRRKNCFKIDETLIYFKILQNKTMKKWFIFNYVTQWEYWLDIQDSTTGIINKSLYYTTIFTKQIWNSRSSVLIQARRTHKFILPTLMKKKILWDGKQIVFTSIAGITTNVDSWLHNYRSSYCGLYFSNLYYLKLNSYTLRNIIRVLILQFQVNQKVNFFYLSDHSNFGNFQTSLLESTLCFDYRKLVKNIYSGKYYIKSQQLKYFKDLVLDHTSILVKLGNLNSELPKTEYLNFDTQLF